ESLLHRHYEVFDGAIRAVDERCRDALRPGFYFDWRRPDIIIDLHIWIDVEERRTLAVNRYFDLLALLARPKHRPDAGVVESHLERVLAIGGKYMGESGSSP